MEHAERMPTRAERKRRDVLEAASRRFTQDGYAGAGMEAVARDAGVSTATLYSYFPSKTDLFRHVVEAATASFTTHLADIEQTDGSVERQLTGFALAYGRFWSAPRSRAIFRLLASERRRFEATSPCLNDLARQSAGSVLIRMLERLEGKGELKIPGRSTAAGQLLGMIEHPTLIHGLLAGDDATTLRPLEETCAEAVTTFLARYGVRTN